MKGNIMSEQLIAALSSYARSVLAGASTLYLAGVTDPLDLAWSLLAAILPVVIRAINPNDTAFGRLPDPVEVAKAAKAATPKKAPAKKAAPAKKTSTK
jgi:hypothetical protein